MIEPQLGKPGAAPAASVLASRSRSSTASDGSATAGRSMASRPTFRRCPTPSSGAIVIATADCANGIAEHVADDRAADDARGPQGPAAARLSTSTSRSRRERAHAARGALRAAETTSSTSSSAAASSCSSPFAGHDRRDPGAGRLARDRRSSGSAVRGSRPVRIASGSRDASYEKKASRQARRQPGALGWVDRRIRLGSRRALHPREGWKAARTDRMVLRLSLEGSGAGPVSSFRTMGSMPAKALIFTRDASGKCDPGRGRECGLPRRRLDGEEGKTFRIKPRRPVEEIRARGPDRLGRRSSRASFASPTWSS